MAHRAGFDEPGRYGDLPRDRHFASDIADRHYLPVNGEIVTTLTNHEIAAEELKIRTLFGGRGRLLAAATVAPTGTRAKRQTK